MSESEKMATCIPIYLEGDNLGVRHRYYNNLVKAAVDQKAVLQAVIQTPERSPIDRIFKIDLASEHRNVDFILQNLKDDDMLFVSRALKCLWLLDPQYIDIINPTHLECNLIPHMIQPAINKTRHWLQHHLKDAIRCQEFYTYYKDQFNLAVKFLGHCSAEFIREELLQIMDKITPKNLKVLCETCPQVSKIYFEKLQSNKTALSNYIKHENNYFQSLKPVLKLDGDLYLDIIEKYYNVEKYGPLNSPATHHIMKQFRSRFNAKPELYARMFLHIKTLAKHLTPDEAKDLVIRLGRAEYLSSWFTYQNVEPLMKRLKVEERAAFKKQIFVDKSVGPSIKEWPYAIPTPFELNISENERVFLDKEHEPYEYEIRESMPYCSRMLQPMYCRGPCDIIPFGKSPLDILFNRYRYTGFERTFEELSKKILSESSIDGRLNMLLVLVSKSGSVPEQMEKLLQWLVEKHINEPITIRAAVVKSFVKRGCVWRLPAKPWGLLLEFGRDLGLDGQTAELLCREGLHAVVIRQLIEDAELSQDLISAFVQEFSTLHEYKLNTDESPLIGKRLATLMLKIKPNAFLDILTEYQLKIEHIPGALDTLIKSARTDPEMARRLFNARIGRRELLRESFALLHDNNSYMNVLRHDVSLLENGKTFTNMLAKERPCHDRFLKSLSLYFNEPNGLATQHKSLLEENVTTNARSQLARPICILSSEQSLLDYLSNFSVSGKSEKKQLQLLASLRANAHKTTPPLDINKVDWTWIGAKAVANRVFICRSNERDRYIKLLLQWKRTARIALHLGTSSIETFTRVSSIRPFVALNFSFSVYFKRNPIEPEIWTVTKQLIENLNPSTINSRLLHKLKHNESIPDNIKVDYWLVIFNMCLKVDKKKALPILCRLENLLPSVDNKTIERVIKQFFSDGLNIEEFKNKQCNDNAERCLYVRIIAKYLLLSKSESEQNKKLETICDAFFDQLKIIFDALKNSSAVIECVKDFLLALKYNKAFLSQQYASCVPVFERVVTRLRKILPIEQFYSYFIKIHLTMLYYKSIKQTMKQNPDTFVNLEQNGKEAMKVVGYIFGNYIGNEIKELVSRYFFSIIDIYKEAMVNYMSDYFEYNDKMSMLVVFIIKGLLNIDHTESLLLAEHLLYRRYEYDIPSSDFDDILKNLKEHKSQEVHFLVFANTW